MKYGRIFTSLFIAALFGATVVGCGKDDDNSSSNGNSTTGGNAGATSTGGRTTGGTSTTGGGGQTDGGVDSGGGGSTGTTGGTVAGGEGGTAGEPTAGGSGAAGEGGSGNVTAGGDGNAGEPAAGGNGVAGEPAAGGDGAAGEPATGGAGGEAAGAGGVEATGGDNAGGVTPGGAGAAGAPPTAGASGVAGAAGAGGQPSAGGEGGGGASTSEVIISALVDTTVLEGGTESLADAGTLGADADDNAAQAGNQETVILIQPDAGALDDLQGTAIAQARLVLTYFADQPDDTDTHDALVVYPVNDSWDAATVTYDTLPATGSTALANIAERQASPYATGELLSIDITDLVASWLDDPSTAYGVMIQNTGADGVDFFSMEDATRPPYIEITLAP